MRPTSWLSLALAAVSAGCTVSDAPAHHADAFVDHPDAMGAFLDAGRDAGPPDAAHYDGPRPDTTCAFVRIDTLRVIPTVVVVIDQSGSMSQPFGATSRWAALEDALIGADGLATRLERDVRFGALTYSDDPEVLGCPDVGEQPASIPALTTLRSLYAVSFPSGNTPTGDAISYALGIRAELFGETPDIGPEILLLATDGEPGTCEDGTDITGGRARTLEAVSAAYAAGIPTYVLSVGTEIAAPHLQAVANAGAGHTAGALDAPYWVATDATSLRTALASIASGALPCTLELTGRIDPARACEGTVTLGADALACGTEWHAVDETHIALSDATCARLRSTTDDLVGLFPCDVVVF